MIMRKTCLAAAAAMVLVCGMPVSAQDRSNPGQPANQPMEKTGARPTTPDTRDASDFQTPSYEKGDKGMRDKMMAAEQPGQMQQWLRKYEGTWKVEVVEEPGTGMSHDNMNRDNPNRDVNDKNISDKARDMNDKTRELNEKNRELNDKNQRDMTMDKDPANRGSWNKTGTSMATSRVEFKHDRHVCSKVNGTYHGQAFEGACVLGYNNATKQFEEAWHDNMHSGINYSTGQLDSAKQVLTMSGECTCPDTGRPMTKRSVSRWVSDDKYVTEVWATESGSSTEKKMATMTFTRESRTVTGVNDSTRDMNDMNRRETPR